MRAKIQSHRIERSFESICWPMFGVDSLPTKIQSHRIELFGVDSLPTEIPKPSNRMILQIYKVYKVRFYEHPLRTSDFIQRLVTWLHPGMAQVYEDNQSISNNKHGLFYRDAKGNSRLCILYNDGVSPERERTTTTREKTNWPVARGSSVE